MLLPPIRCFNTGRTFVSEHACFTAMVDIMKKFRKVLFKKREYDGHVFFTLYDVELYMRKMKTTLYSDCPQEVKDYIQDSSENEKYTYSTDIENMRLDAIRVFTLNTQGKADTEDDLVVPLSKDIILDGLKVRRTTERMRILGREYLPQPLTMKEIEEEDTTGMYEFIVEMRKTFKEKRRKLPEEREQIIELITKEGIPGLIPKKTREEAEKIEVLYITPDKSDTLDALTTELPDIFEVDPYTLEYNIPLIDGNYVIPMTEKKLEELIEFQEKRIEDEIKREKISLPSQEKRKREKFMRKAMDKIESIKRVVVKSGLLNIILKTSVSEVDELFEKMGFISVKEKDLKTMKSLSELIPNVVDSSKKAYGIGVIEGEYRIPLTKKYVIMFENIKEDIRELDIFSGSSIIKTSNYGDFKIQYLKSILASLEIDTIQESTERKVGRKVPIFKAR